MKAVRCVALALILASPAAAAPVPDAVRAMIDAALASDDPATVSAVVAVAKRANPDSVAEIDALLAGYNRDAAARAEAKTRAERDRLASAGVFSLWAGQLELGGSWSTGNTSTLGAYGAAKLKRTGLDWQHDLSLRVDYQETDKQPTTERAVAAWQPRYKFDRTYYAYGLTQYEHDRFLGYRHRLTAGAGLGVVVADTPKLHLEFDAGPALRYTRFYEDEPNERRLAGRGGLNMKWTPWPRVTIAQELAVYVEKDDTTATSTTSIETRLFGPLKGKLSYNVQYERDAPADQKTTDTVSRVSLVYGF